MMDNAGSAPAKKPKRPINRPGSAPWALAGAIFLAVCGTSVGLSGVVRGGTWLIFIAFTVGTVLAAMALARTLRAPAALVPVVGGITLLLQLTFVFFSSTAFLAIIPTPASFDQLGTLLSQASQTVIRDTAPVQASSGVLLVICFGTGLVAMLVDALAIGVMMPAISGFGLLTIALIPATVKPESLGLFGFIFGAAGYLLILFLAQWYLTDSQKRRSGSEMFRIAGIGAGAVVLALLIALVTPGFSSGTFPQGSRLTPFGQVAGLSPFLSLGNDLRNPSGTGEINYATTAANPPYLRTLTIESFEGDSWQPTDRNAEYQLNPDMIQNDFIASGTQSQSVLTQINPLNFSGDWLPAPYAPQRVTGLSGRWVWDPKTLVIKALDQGALGQNYQVQSIEPVLTPAVLETAITPPRPSLDPIFMALPANTPSIIRETALDVTGRSPTYYDKAMSIQQYLRGTDFSYSLQAPVSGGYDGSSMDALAKFLQVKSGYCVHFSAAMAVMAREAGIPSRIAVGFAPGTPTGQTVEVNGEKLTQYQVDGRSAHAWPELYFEGMGWVPFEPTPSRGQVPSYAQPPLTPDPSDAPEPELSKKPTATPQPSNLPVPAPQSGSGNAGGPGFNVFWLVIPLLVLAALAVPSLSRNAVRRRRLSAAATAHSAWSEMRDTAFDFGLEPMRSDTPRRFAARLDDSGLAGTPGPDVHVLVQSFERASYGPPATKFPLTIDSAELAEARSAISALHKNAPFSVRLRVALFPRTSIRRLANLLAKPLKSQPVRRFKACLARVGARLRNPFQKT